MSRVSFSEGNHQYRLKGHRYPVPSVSSLVGMLHRFDADDWVMGQVAEEIADRWDVIGKEPPTSRTARIKTAALERRWRDAEFGKAVHHYAQHLWTGESIQVPDLYLGHVEALAAWWGAEQPELLAAERIVYADDDPDWGLSACAGTLDLLVKHAGHGVGLLDIKTWAPWRKGEATAQKQAQWAMQLAAYAGMDRMQAADPSDEDVPLPRVDWLGILHTGPSGCTMHVVPHEDRLRANAQVETARMLRALPKPSMQVVA